MDDVKYSKIKNGKDGLYELDFEELTEDLIKFFEKDSYVEIALLRKIATETPGVLNDCSPESVWGTISTQLEKFEISKNVTTLYEYQGHHYSLKNYLQVRGNLERKMALIVTAMLVDIALEVSRHKFSHDFEAALKASEKFFACGIMFGNAWFEKYTIAGGGRYGSREDEGQAVERREKLNKIVTFVTPIIKNNPTIHMTTLRAKIIKNKIVHQSPDVIYDYLKELKKGGEIYK